MTSGLITLLTDFGLHDPFVGVMKGIIWGRAPELRIIDSTHFISPQDVLEGTYWLERAYRFFPTGTVHVAVVDPGVGTERAALVARAQGHLFVAPDNGILSRLLVSPGVELRRLSLSAFGLPPPSRTFHGRDVFAPAAAELAAGRVRFSAVGPPAPSPVRMPEANARVSGNSISGIVITCDHFGNAITNIEQQQIADLSNPVVRAAGQEWLLRTTYADVPVGTALALMNAFETVEIAVREGSATEQLGLRRGHLVEVSASPPPNET